MFLNHLDAQTIPDLESLNSQFRAWVEGEYHFSPHRGIDGETPLDRWARSDEQIQFPNPGTDLEQMFLFEAKRKVNNARTVSLHNRLYEVEASLRRQTVTLRYDPTAPHS